MNCWYDFTVFQRQNGSTNQSKCFCFPYLDNPCRICESIDRSVAPAAQHGFTFSLIIIQLEKDEVSFGSHWSTAKIIFGINFQPDQKRPKHVQRGFDYFVLCMLSDDVRIAHRVLERWDGEEHRRPQLYYLPLREWKKRSKIGIGPIWTTGKEKLLWPFLYFTFFDTFAK